MKKPEDEGFVLRRWHILVWMAGVTGYGLLMSAVGASQGAMIVAGACTGVGSAFYLAYRAGKG